MIDAVNIDYRSELLRKAIHLCSLSIPVVYYFISRESALAILIPLTSAFLIVDLLRYYHAPTGELFYKIFRPMLRSHEQDEQAKRLNGATNVLIAASLCVILFPKLITVTAFSVLIVSDSIAALVGRRFGRRKFFKKSIEGSTAFFLSAVIVVLATPKISYTAGEYAIAIFSAAVGTVIEALSIQIDDNLSIPLSIGVVMWGLYMLFFPSLNLYSHTLGQ